MPSPRTRLLTRPLGPRPSSIKKTEAEAACLAPHGGLHPVRRRPAPASPRIDVPPTPSLSAYRVVWRPHALPAPSIPPDPFPNSPPRTLGCCLHLRLCSETAVVDHSPVEDETHVTLVRLDPDAPSSLAGGIGPHDRRAPRRRASTPPRRPWRAPLQGYARLR